MPISQDQPVRYLMENRRPVQVLTAAQSLGYREALERLGLFPPRPSLVIIGGASNMTSESLQRLKVIFQQVLAPLAQELSAVVLDGGTDAGVIQMMGQARRWVKGTFRLVGVAPLGKVRLPNELGTGESESRKALEPNHTDFCLIPGNSWGSESPWLAGLASTLAGEAPALTLLINGGNIARVDLAANLATGRPALVLAGSGRLADAIATATTAPHAVEDPAVLKLVRTYYPQQLSVFDLAQPLDQLAVRLRHLMQCHD